MKKLSHKLYVNEHDSKERERRRSISTVEAPSIDVWMSAYERKEERKKNEKETQL